MSLQRRHGIDESVTVLAAVIIAILAGAFLLFLVSTGSQDASGFLQDAEDDVESNVDDQKSGIRKTIVDSIKAGIGDIAFGNPC